MSRAPGADQDRVIIVGAGLAGLTCAKVLAAAGVDFLLLEAESEPGGRAVSRRIDEGFILDRGFQVLLDSYPAARRHLDFAALGGGRFRAGAMFVGRGYPRTLSNPLRHPAAFFTASFAGVLDWSDQFRFVSAATGALLRSESSLRRLAGSALDESAEEWFLRRGFGGRFMSDFARPFFGGVLLDPALETSAALMLSYLRRFATGRALVPGEGIGAIGRQLAARLPGGSVRFGAPVESLLPGKGVILRGGEVCAGSRVVLAVAEPAVCRLLGGNPRPARRTIVHYFAAERKWHDGAWLCLPPRGAGQPVLHAALVSNAAPSLAPPGRHLWSATVDPSHPAAGDAAVVARAIASWFGEEAGGLRPLDCVEVPYAVPEQPPGFAGRALPWGEAPPGVWVTGDAAGVASIDAAMSGGEAVAENLIASLRLG